MEACKGGLPTASRVLGLKYTYREDRKVRGFLLLHISFSAKMGPKPCKLPAPSKRPASGGEETQASSEMVPHLSQLWKGWDSSGNALGEGGCLVTGDSFTVSPAPLALELLPPGVR